MAAIRINFQQKLDELRERLLVMAGLVEQAIDRAIEAYETRDANLCDLVRMSEPAIDRMEREIDQLGLDLLAMEQPTAIDLRFILAIIRINADLERVGDQAVNIASRARELLAIPEAQLPVDIPAIAEIASTMVRKALQAFIGRDAGLANAVLAMDDEVDTLNYEAFQNLSRTIQSTPEVTHQALNALVISRNLERVGDHATNIAEDVIFWISGADVRHHAVSQITDLTAPSQS